MQTLQQAAVYWIRLPEHTEITKQGYVGVSKNPEKRWEGHLRQSKKYTKENNHLYHSINKYSWDKLIKETILYGEESYCYETELYLRPISNIGWNTVPGGNGLPTKEKDPEFWILREKSKEQEYLEWTQTEEYADEEWQYQQYLKEQQRYKEQKEYQENKVHQQYIRYQHVRTIFKINT